MGGSSGGVKGGAQQVPNMDPAQMKVLNNLAGLMQGQIGKGVTPYGGQLTAGQSGLQEGANSLVSQMLNGTAPGQAQTQNTLNSINTPWTPQQATSNWTQQVQAPTMQNFNENVLPGIEEKFAGQNAMGGGGAQDQLLKAGTDLSTGLGASLGSYLQQGQQQGNAQAMQAAGLQDAFNAGNVTEGLQAGAGQQGTEQAALSAAQQNWGQGQAYNNPWLTQFLGTTLGQSENTLATPSGIPGMLGGLGSLGSLFATPGGIGGASAASGIGAALSGM